MMKKLFIAITIIALCFGLSIGSVFAFDKQPVDLKEFTRPSHIAPDEEYYVNLEDGFFDVTVFGTAEGLLPVFDYATWTFEGWKRCTGIFAQSGSGFHIGNGYIVTAAHVVLPKYVKIQQSKHTYFLLYVDKMLTRTITLGNEELGNAVADLVWINEVSDLALLKVQGTWPALHDYGYRPMATWAYEYQYTYDRLEKGDAIATIVRVRDEEGSKSWNYEIRYGTVIDVGTALPKGAPNQNMTWFNPLDFTMDITLYGGDSGSPVFAFYYGKPVIIGVARAFAYNCWWEKDYASKKLRSDCDWYTYAVRIDPIANKVEFELTEIK